MRAQEAFFKDRRPEAEATGTPLLLHFNQSPRRASSRQSSSGRMMGTPTVTFLVTHASIVPPLQTIFGGALAVMLFALRSLVIEP
ncbi:MAG: hypothetical protein RLZZ450_318 [Pseudomonadota bacterium]|jgi:hypothetical protein